MQGNSFRFTNYRPISLLPSMSNILNNVVLEQLLNYMEDNKLFGLRPGIKFASLKWVDTMVQHLDKY